MIYLPPRYGHGGTDGAECGRACVPLTDKPCEVNCQECLSMLESEYGYKRQTDKPTRSERNSLRLAQAIESSPDPECYIEPASPEGVGFVASDSLTLDPIDADDSCEALANRLRALGYVVRFAS